MLYLCREQLNTTIMKNQFKVLFEQLNTLQSSRVTNRIKFHKSRKHDVIDTLADEYGIIMGDINSVNEKIELLINKL